MKNIPLATARKSPSRKEMGCRVTVGDMRNLMRLLASMPWVTSPIAR